MIEWWWGSTLQKPLPRSTWSQKSLPSLGNKKKERKKASSGQHTRQSCHCHINVDVWILPNQRALQSQSWGEALLDVIVTILLRSFLSYRAREIERRDCRHVKEKQSRCVCVVIGNGSHQCQLLTFVASARSSTIHRGSPSPHLAMFLSWERIETSKRRLEKESYSRPWWFALW